MRNIVMELDGVRHKLVPVEIGEFSCGDCSLNKYCKGDPLGEPALICEKLDRDSIKLNLHFKLDGDERREA